MTAGILFTFFEDHSGGDSFEGRSLSHLYNTLFTSILRARARVLGFGSMDQWMDFSVCLMTVSMSDLRVLLLADSLCMPPSADNR